MFLTRVKYLIVFDQGIMIRFFIFFLICQFEKLFIVSAWSIETSRTEKRFLFIGSRAFYTVIESLNLHLYLEPKEEFLLKFSNTKAKTFQTWLTLLDYSHYPKLMRKFGDFLFTNEIFKHEMAEFYFERTFNIIRIGWMIVDNERANKNYLILRKLFDQHFLELSDGIKHLLFNFPFHLKQIHGNKVKFDGSNKSKLFANKNNFLEIYSKGSFNFDNEMTVACAKINPTKGKSSEINVLDRLQKGFTIESNVRFGRFQSGTFSLPSFIFYQIDNDLKKDKEENRNSNLMKRSEDDDKKVIIIRPPGNIKNIPEFLNFLINFVINHCS